MLFVSVRRTVFVSVSAAEAVGFRLADPHGRCNSIKPLCGSASRKSRQRFAAFAAFVVTAKRPLSEAQNLNRPLYNFNLSLQLSTVRLRLWTSTIHLLFNCQRSKPRRVRGGLRSGLNHMPREISPLYVLIFDGGWQIENEKSFYGLRLSCLI